ncbi:MAG TPA: hypothetical protein DCZ94_13145 [Lentisphaeria bacterium]|nr:MAG: hypothetical protein A2X48_15340 [Lentisphaerae bacterium GWF2_49_21]HBC87895.1 hypothetical protein [Lentisphaeria bacterium]
MKMPRLFAGFLTGFFLIQMCVLAQEPAVPDDIRKFADSINTSINSGDPSVMNSAFDKPKFIDRIIGGQQIKPDVLSGFTKGFSKGFTYGSELVRAQAKLKTLRLYKDKEGYHQLVRMQLGDAVAYLDFLLEKGAGGIRIIDCFVFVTGENLSETLSRNVMPSLMRESKNVITKALTPKDNFLLHMDKISDMRKNNVAQNYKESLAIYNALPAELKKEKAIMMMRFSAAQGLGVDTPEYLQAMQDFEKTFPGEPCLALILIDYYFMKKDFGKVDKCITDLEKALKCTDPYLYYMRGINASLAGRNADALKHLEKAIELEPDADTYQLLLLKLLVDEKNWAQVVKVMEGMDKNFKYKFPDIETAPLFSEFIKTDEYRKWKSARSNSPDSPPVAPQKTGTGNGNSGKKSSFRMLEPVAK